MTTSREPSQSLQPIDSRRASEWRAWAYGPRELELRCVGGIAARAIVSFHQRWPFLWGHSRLSVTLGRFGLFEDVPFVSASGCLLHLDLGRHEFLHLSGRLPTEPLEVSLLSRLVRQGDIFVDVGAFGGLYIANIAGRLGAAGRYHAFEPSPTHVKGLRRVFRDVSNLTLHECALSEHGGEGCLSDQEWFTAKLDEVGPEGGVRVPVRRLDEVLTSESRARHWIVKIDVEGHEAKVLRGADGLFAAGLRPTVMLEFLPDQQPQARNELLAVMESYFGVKYRWYSICQKHGTLHPFKTDLKLHEVLNILLVPEEQHGRVASALLDLPP